MTDKQPSKAMNATLWVAQVLLAASLLMGAVMKFMPIEKTVPMMPWMRQVSPTIVRLLGLVDLLGGLGLILPDMLRIKPRLTVITALCIIALMVCASVFHVTRGEESKIGFNIFCIVLAAFIAWGRLSKTPITPK